MHTMRLSLEVMTVVCLLQVACNSSGINGAPTPDMTATPGPTATPTVSNTPIPTHTPFTLSVNAYGGQVALYAYSDGAAGSYLASSLFAPSLTPEYVYSTTYGDGHCAVTATLPPASGNWLSAGPSLTYQSGTTSLVAQRQGPVDSNDSTVYLLESNQPVTPGSSWTVTNAGTSGGLAASTLATVVLPGDFTTVTIPTVVAGTAATFVYSDQSGADTIWIEIDGQAGVVDCYPPSSPGTFTISSSMTAAAGANIQVGRVYAMNIGLSTVDGRQIVYSAAIVAN